MSSPADVQMFRATVSVLGHPEMPQRTYTILGKRSFVVQKAKDHYRNDDFSVVHESGGIEHSPKGNIATSVALDVTLVPLKAEVGTILAPEVLPQMHTVRKFKNNPGKGRKSKGRK